jgi:AraC-like DNA-binding protein
MGELYKSVYHFDNSYNEKPRIFSDIKLVQVGDLKCRPDAVIGEHEQPCFEITYIESGRGASIINGKVIKLSRGMINITLKNDKHTILADSADPLRYFYLAFDLALSHPLYKTYKQIQENIADESLRTKRDRFNIAELFTRCLAEFSHKNEFSNIIIEDTVNLIISYVFQTFYNRAYGYKPKFESYEMFVYDMVNYIEENILKIKSVETVAKHFNYSASYISHIFSDSMHKTLAAFVNETRMKYSLLMLEDDDYSITKIAKLLYYSSVQSFSRAFKVRFKMSPQQYRASLEKKEAV